MKELAGPVAITWPNGLKWDAQISRVESFMGVVEVVASLIGEPIMPNEDLTKKYRSIDEPWR